MFTERNSNWSQFNYQIYCWFHCDPFTHFKCVVVVLEYIVASLFSGFSRNENSLLEVSEFCTQ